MLSVSAARQFVKLPEQAAAALLAVDPRRSRPARSSTSLFDQLGDTSSTGTLQASSAQRAFHSPRSGAFRKNGLLLKRAMESFSFELEATEVFYGENQS